MSDNVKGFLCVMLAMVMTIILPDLALAQSSAIGGALCDWVGELTGPVGQGVATLAVVFFGIGAFFGKVNWGLAVVVGVGIAGIFGATSIVRIIGGASSC